MAVQVKAKGQRSRDRNAKDTRADAPGRAGRSDGNPRADARGATE